MEIRIVTDENQLKKPCEDVKDVEEAKKIAEILKSAIILFDGAGISANQIGINKRMSIIKDSRKEYLYLINPEIIEKENEFIFNGEGCLSFPLRFFITKRFEGITIKNYVIDGNELREEKQYFYSDPNIVNDKSKINISDLQGICVQHEMDHQNGRIITEYNIGQVSGQIINKDKIGRNDKCPCGSNKKFKNCCMKNG